MRGKLSLFGRKKTGYRITPADAGKTYRRNWVAHYEEDHPRGCGENRFEPTQSS